MICGVSGFIGQNLFEHFSSLDNYEVYGTYLDNKPKASNSKMVRADLRKKEIALQVTRNMDIVINAAASKVGGIGIFSVKEVAEDKAKTNKLINANLAEAAHLNNVGRFVFLSCTVMYPSSDVPLTEDEVDPNIIDPIYSISAEIKTSAEELCRHFSNLGKTKYTIVRHTNIYGPHDKFDLAYSHVLASTIIKVAQAEKEITVWGQGTETRDFLYISDLLAFIQSAIKLQDSNFEIFNVGLGRSYSIKELVQVIISRSGKNLNIAYDLTKPTINAHITVDVGKAWKHFEWKAMIDLPEGIAKTIEWYRQSLN